MIDVYSELKLFGSEDKIYKDLKQLVYFRNRIHIKNYCNNFEKDEKITFSEKRVQCSIRIMESLFYFFRDNYPRPWPEQNK